jgi:hypothetical protein
VLCWIACALLFILYLWLTGPRSLPGIFLLVFLLVIIAAGVWKTSKSVEAIPASIRIDETKLSIIHSSLLGKQTVESYELARIQDLKTLARGSRYRKLVIVMADGEQRMWREVDAETALEVERSYGQYRDRAGP